MIDHTYPKKWHPQGTPGWLRMRSVVISVAALAACATVYALSSWFRRPKKRGGDWSAWSARVSRGCAPRHQAERLTPVVVCENVDDYRRVIPRVIRDTDVRAQQLAS